MIKLLVLIFMGSWVAACYQLLYNVTQIVTLTTDINHYDFDSNWTMEYDSALSKVFIQQPPSPSMQFTGVNFGNVDFLVVNHTITANSTVVFVLGSTVRVYNFSLGFSLLDTITMPDKVVKVRIDEQYLSGSPLQPDDEKIRQYFQLLLFFISVLYSFVFYPLVYRYERRQMSSEVLEVSSFQSGSFWLEMTVKCVRSFLKATAHGIFINQQSFQLVFLITIDIGFIYIIRLRKSFSFKILFALVLIYFIIFLALDIGLLVYTIQLSFSGTLTDQKLIYYSFVFTLIILALLVVTILRIAILIIVTVYRSIRHFKDNKVQNKKCLAEIKIAKSRVKNINYMSRNPNQKKRVVFMHKKEGFDEQYLKKTEKKMKNSRQPKTDMKSNLHKFILKIMNTPNVTKKGINESEQGI